MAMTSTRPDRSQEHHLSDVRPAHRGYLSVAACWWWICHCQERGDPLRDAQSFGPDSQNFNETNV